MVVTLTLKILLMKRCIDEVLCRRNVVLTKSFRRNVVSTKLFRQCFVDQQYSYPVEARNLYRTHALTIVFSHLHDCSSVYQKKISTTIVINALLIQSIHWFPHEHFFSPSFFEK